MTPAEEFRAARAKLGYTQARLAGALGFKRGRQTVCDIEKGRHMPRKTVVLLLRALVAAKTPTEARPMSKLG